jgi:hypothetical protein
VQKLADRPMTAGEANVRVTVRRWGMNSLAVAITERKLAAFRQRGP